MNALKLALILPLLCCTTAGGGPPVGAYLAWLQAKFPAAYGNPALEATVWGDHADPDGDGCPNILEFMMARDPKTADDHLGPRCRIEGDDLVITYRKTTATGHGIDLHGEWSTDMAFWVKAGVRSQTVDDTRPDYHLIEARINRNRETTMWFRLGANR